MLRSVGLFDGGSVITYKNGLPSQLVRDKTAMYIRSSDYQKRLIGYRMVANAFVSNPTTKEYFFKKSNYSCQRCGSSRELQIHHKIWIYRFAKDEMPVEDMNQEENIMVLCKNCHLREKEVKL